MFGKNIHIKNKFNNMKFDIPVDHNKENLERYESNKNGRGDREALT